MKHKPLLAGTTLAALLVLELVQHADHVSVGGSQGPFLFELLLFFQYDGVQVI